jgi:REP element-mobilizing transposase RayT
MKSDPIAFFITWSTHGTWLPGDPRGWVEYHHGWKLPDPVRHLEATESMTGNACLLSEDDRRNVEEQIAETCKHRDWLLHAVNCRSNHVHIVVAACDTKPKNIQADIKAWCSRRLKQQSDPGREHWWADRGSQRWIWNEESLEKVVLYVTEAQDRKYRDHLQSHDNA